MALGGLDLEDYPGEVLAVCSANGAGKSTFARLLAGQETPSTGKITIAGHDGPVTSPADAERVGILLVHQEPLVLDDFTIGENVWLFTLRSGRDVKAWHARRRTDDEQTRQVLRGVGLGNTSPNRPAVDLGPGQRQRLALSRAAVTPHKIMILDETTASTTEEHFKDVEQLLREERDAGTSIVFVSHRLPEVFAVRPHRRAVQRQARQRPPDQWDHDGGGHHTDGGYRPEGS